MRYQRFRIASGVFAIVLAYAASAGLILARAAETAEAGGAGPEAGRVEFNHPGGGAPAVQIDLPAGLWGDVVGLGDAAVAGVAEALAQAKSGNDATAADAKFATEQLAAIRAIVSSVQGALGEVRVRLYRGDEGGDIDAAEIAEYYGKQLEGSEWSRIVHVRDGGKTASVFLMRRDGAIRGVFVVANEGRQMALVNVLCDISPERVKQITRQATAMGLELGGDEALREIVEEIRGGR